MFNNGILWSHAESLGRRICFSNPSTFFYMNKEKELHYISLECLYNEVLSV